MGRLINTGIATALVFGAGACYESSNNNLSSELQNESTGVNVIPVLPGSIYRHPNAINNPKEIAGILELGKRTVAVCYYESATLATDSVGIKNSGYAFVNDGIVNRNEVFNVSGEDLRNALPSCAVK